ncbi:MAG: MFS transporter [SAR202 cluster bacterium]|nr:MFS transporter [SAR202 cluster bacterium]
MSTTQAAASVQPEGGPFRSLVNCDWRMLWTAGTLWNICFFAELLFLTTIALNLTGASSQVAIVGALRFLPQAFIGLFAGLQADRLPKRRVMMVAQAFNLVSTLSMTALIFAGVLAMPMVYAAALLTGIAWAIDYPVRRAYARDLLSREQIVNAMALDAASLEGMIMVGRVVAGLLLTLAGPKLGYAALSVLYVTGFVLLMRVRSTPVAVTEGPRPSVLHTLLVGFRAMFSNPILRGVFLVTFSANLFLYPYFSFAPVFAERVFHIGEGLLGVMSSMDGAGALVGASLLAAMTTVRRPGYWFALGMSVLGIAVALFAYSPNVGVAMVMLFLGGIGMGASQAMSTALPVSEATESTRGSVMGVNMVAMGMLPFGLLWVGWLADQIGIQAAVAINTLIAATVCAAVLATIRPLRRR